MKKAQSLRTRLRTLLHAIVCLLSVAAASPPPAAAAGYGAGGPLHASLITAEEKKGESCGQGKATKDFGWKVVSFGVSTLKYLIGLLIIPIGLFLVVIGAIIEVVEAVAC